MIVVVFQPYAMSMFLNIPTSLFYNQEVSGYDLECKSLNELATQISDCKDNSICISYIEKWLLSQIADSLLDTTYKIKRIDTAWKSHATLTPLVKGVKVAWLFHVLHY